MQAPDFAQLGPSQFRESDLRFLFEHFPVSGIDIDEAVRLAIERPSTLESLLDSDYVFRAIRDHRLRWLQVSPKLLFNVLLRRTLPGPRTPLQRQTIYYLSHVLELFMHTERLYRVQSGSEEPSFEYLVDLVREATASDPARGFLVHTHIGNYALYLSGRCRAWIEHRYRYKRRPMSLDYYCSMGRSYYYSASRHRAAEDFGLRGIFGHLAAHFEDYRAGLERLPLGQLASSA